MSKITLTKKDISDLQELAFIEVSKKINERLPDPSLRIVVPNDVINNDFIKLKSDGLLVWDASVKFWALCDLTESHPIKMAVYYRKLPIGFAIGGYNVTTNSVEVSLLEKRKDAHSDLNKQFLPIVIETFAGYSLALSLNGIYPEKIALINPLSEKIPYYIGSGFRFEKNYFKSISAMILDRKNPL